MLLVVLLLVLEVVQLPATGVVGVQHHLLLLVVRSSQSAADSWGV